MKRIKHIKELRKEREKLTHRQKELTQLIHSDWIEIKETTKLKNILKNKLTPYGRQTRTGTSWIEGLTNHAGLFARKIARQAKNKIETKMSEKVESVLDGFFTKRK
jgi:hypothetical protein